MIWQIAQRSKLLTSQGDIIDALQLSKDIMPSFKEWAWCSITVARRRTRGRRKLLAFFHLVAPPLCHSAFRNMLVCSAEYTWGLVAANVITCKQFVSLSWTADAADAKDDIVRQEPKADLYSTCASHLIQDSMVSCFVAFIIAFRTARSLFHRRGKQEDLARRVEAAVIHMPSCVIPLECLVQTCRMQIDRPRNMPHGPSVLDARRFSFLKYVASVSLHCLAQVESITGERGRSCEGDLLMANMLLRCVFRIQQDSNQCNCACALLR